MFCDINALHPFREGNGRTQREFITCLGNINGIDLDFSQISQKEMIIASHEANNGSSAKMKQIFHKSYSILSIDRQLDFIEKIISDTSLAMKYIKYLQQIK